MRGLKALYIGVMLKRIQKRIAAEPGGEIDDGRPMPPADLITLVSSTPNRIWFSRGGQQLAASLSALASRHGPELASGITVLDFGCGCGRVARWLAPDVLDGGGRFLGSDINPALVGWCREHLAGDYRRNRLSPRAPVASGSVDVLYALSVVTHLTQPRAEAWLGDFARMLRPGGLALISFHDEDFRAEPMMDQLRRDGYAVNTTVLEGSNFLAAYATRAMFRSLCERWFEVLDILPSQADEEIQAMAVLRRQPV